MTGRKRGLEERQTRRKKKINIEDTEAWQTADFDYLDLTTRSMLPFLQAPLTVHERMDYLKEIIKGCPDFYLALIDLGYRYLQEGMDDTGKAYIDKGLQSLKTHFSKNKLIDAFYDICEFLEERLRFEMAIGYYNALMEFESDTAKVYDSLSYCYFCLGDMEQVLESQRKALELCDTNPRFFCNMGWFKLIQGDLAAAKAMLEKSLALDPEDDITLNNYAACKQMLKSKRLKNWEKYLIRETDYEYLNKLESEDDYEGYEKQVRIYNRDKVEAFRIELVRNSKYTPTEKYDLLFSLTYTFDIIREAYYSEYFFYDDIDELRDNFKTIMHKVILKTGDIDEEIFNGVYTALLEFYKYLANRKVVSGYKSLTDEMRDLKPELMETMLRYNEIRHNDEYTQEEKAELREDLFAGGALWPFL